MREQARELSLAQACADERGELVETNMKELREVRMSLDEKSAELEASSLYLQTMLLMI